MNPTHPPTETAFDGYVQVGEPQKPVGYTLTTTPTETGKRQKCRCYINLKTYGRAASKGGAMRGYKPCPVPGHENNSIPPTETVSDCPHDYVTWYKPLDYGICISCRTRVQDRITPSPPTEPKVDKKPIMRKGEL